jgi:hypothetical protein
LFAGEVLPAQVQTPDKSIHDGTNVSGPWIHRGYISVAVSTTNPADHFSLGIAQAYMPLGNFPAIRSEVARFDFANCGTTNQKGRQEYAAYLLENRAGNIAC